MSSDDRYFVVINHEEQYSIWPDDAPPEGWTVVAGPDSKDACLARIEELWTDMRPKSLREFMAQPEPEPEPQPETEAPLESDLPARLAVEQELHLELFEPYTRARAAEVLAGEVAHLRFPGTRGGTLLAIKLDDASRGQTLEGERARVSGTLELDFVACECAATIALSDGHGRGALRRLEP